MNPIPGQTHRKRLGGIQEVALRCVDYPRVFE